MESGVRSQREAMWGERGEFRRDAGARPPQAAALQQSGGSLYWRKNRIASGREITLLAGAWDSSTA